MVSKTSQTSLQILYALSFSHLLNDTIQSVLPAIFPVLQESFQLSFTQIGLISFTLQMTASVLQPMIGFYADRRPQPYSLAVGMGFTLVGLLILSQAVRLEAMLLSAALVGIGSSVFHPEASRVAHLASGGRYGLAQSLFQVGGNLGTSLGPLLAAGIIVPHGQSSIAWFSLLAILGMVVLIRVGSWSQTHVRRAKQNPQILQRLHKSFLPASQIDPALLILLVLIISKYFYLANFTNFYTFYLMSKFRLSVQASQVCLFVFLFSVAVGTIFGGPLGDRFGRKVVIWFSILGAAPFSMALPHVGLVGT
ncbi:MAG: MFS transporter, partial [Acidobacteria bacterium]|nr:MFS transporter [Acidobacteriota bacterium]